MIPIVCIVFKHVKKCAVIRLIESYDEAPTNTVLQSIRGSEKFKPDRISKVLQSCSRSIVEGSHHAFPIPKNLIIILNFIHPISEVQFQI